MTTATRTKKKPGRKTGHQVPFEVTFGYRITAARKQKGWTQNQLARHIGMSQPLVACLERGRNNTSVPTLLRLIDVLELDPGDLLRQ